MLDRIKRIIDSCETFDQVQTCTSFVEQPRPGIGLTEKQQILNWLLEKANALHSQNLEFHRQEMTRLRQERHDALTSPGQDLV